MKTIVIGNMTLELTPERIRRIQSAITETQRLIDREMKYSEEFRNQKRIDGWKAHIEKLESYLK